MLNLPDLPTTKSTPLTVGSSAKSTSAVRPRFESIPNGYKFIKPTAARESTDYVPASPTAKFANLSQFLGGGQYTQDSTQPNLLEKSKAVYSPGLNDELAGGPLFRNKVEIDHTIPLWLGGTDTPDNKIALPIAEHDIKTKQNAVIEALYYAGKIDLPEARVMAINWQNKDITGINPSSKTGQISLAVAEKKYKEWQKPTEVSMGDVLKTWGKKLGSFATLGAYKGEPSKTDLGEQLYAKSLNEGNRGVVGQFAQGVASGATMGQVSASSTAGESLGETVARGTGQLAGTLATFSWLGKLAGIAGKAVFGAKAIPLATKTSLLTKPLFGTGKTASKLPVWLEKLNKTTATFKPLGISVPKNVASKALLNAGLFTLHGQLSKQEENNFGGRVKRFLSDAAFGTMLAIPGQTAKGYAGLAAGTYTLSAIEGATPGEAMMNTAIVVGLHGFGAVGYDAKVQKLATDAAIKERAKWGIEPPKPGEKITSERISDENMSVIENVYRGSENPADFKKNMEALVISGRQIYKGGLGKEMSFIEDLKDAKSLVQRTNKMTEAEINRVPNDIPDLFDMSERPSSLRGDISAMDAPFERELLTSTGISSDVNSRTNQDILNFMKAGGKEGDKVIIRLVTDPKEIEVYRKISESQTPERQFNPENVIEVFGKKDGEYYSLGKVPTERRLNDMTIAPEQVLVGDEMVDMPMGIIPSRTKWGLPNERIPKSEMNTDNVAKLMKERGTRFVTGKISKLMPITEVDGKMVFTSGSGQPIVDFEITKNDWLGTTDINKNLNKKVSDKMSKTIVNRPQVQPISEITPIETPVNPEQGTILNTITQKYPGSDMFAIFPDAFRERLATKNPEALVTGLKEDYGVTIDVNKAKAVIDRAENITVRDYLSFLSENRTQPQVQTILNNIFSNESFYVLLSKAERENINKLKLLAPGPKPETTISENIPVKPLEELQQENTIAPIETAREKIGVQTTLPVAETPAKYTALSKQTTGGAPLAVPVSINKTEEVKKIVRPTVEKTPKVIEQSKKTTVKQPQKTLKIIKSLTIDGKVMTEKAIKEKFKEIKTTGNKKEINKWADYVDKIVQAKERTINVSSFQNDSNSSLQRQLDDLATDRINAENYLTAEDVSRKAIETTQTGNISELTAETTPKNVFDDAIMGDIIVKRDGVYTYNKDQVKHEYSGFKKIGDSVEGTYLGSRTGMNKFDSSKEQQIYEVQKSNGTIVDVYSKPSIDKQMGKVKSGQGVKFELTDKIKSKTPGYSPFNVITVSSIPIKENAKPIVAEEGVVLGKDIKEVTNYLNNNRETYLNIISDVNKKNEGWKYPEKHPETKWTVKASPTAYIAEFKRGIDKGLKGNKNARAFNYTLDESLKNIFGKDYQNNDKLSSLLNPTEGKGKTIWNDLYKTIGESQPKDVVLKEAEARKAGKSYLGKEEYQAIYQKRKEQAATEADARYEGSDNVIVTNPATGREVLVNKKEYIGSLPEQDMSRLDTVTDLTRFDSLLKSLRAAEVTGKALTPEDATLTAKDLLYKLIKLYNENYPKSNNGENVKINPAELKKIIELSLK